MFKVMFMHHKQDIVIKVCALCESCEWLSSGGATDISILCLSSKQEASSGIAIWI